MVRKVHGDKARHFTEMMKSLEEMRIDGEHCDFLIKIGDKKLCAHRNIISAGSEYFRAMLRHDTLENQRAEVEMRDIDYECVKSCIDYIYTVEFEVPDDKLEDLLHSAQIMQLKNVSDEVSNILESSLNMENYFRTRQTAKLFNLRNLVLKCDNFGRENLMALSKQPGFLNEEKCYILGALKSTKRSLSEEEKLEVAINWVRGEKDRRKNFIDFLKIIKLNAISPEYLDNLIETHPLITNDSDLLKVFYRAHKESMNKMLSDRKMDQDRKLVLFDKHADALKSINPDTNELSMISKAKFSHFECFTAVSLNSVIYVLCEDQSIHRLKFRKKYATWERLRDTITDHGSYPPVVSAHGSLVVIGYGSYANASGAVELYQTSSEKWIRLEDKPEAVAYPALVSLGDSIYSAGGYNEEMDVSDAFCELNLITSKWTGLESMRNKKVGCASAAVNDKIFIFGGWRDEDTLNEVECYDVLTSQWQTLSPMLIGVGACMAQHINGMIIVGKRQGKSEKLMKYDVSNDRWHEVEVNGFAPFKVYDMLTI